jgi:hypothetical protein
MQKMSSPRNSYYDDNYTPEMEEYGEGDGEAGTDEVED